MRNLRLELGRALKFVDGAPDITGLPCDKITAAEAGDYMRRYHLEHYPDGHGMRFHHILASDPGTDLHDHPWDFVSVMLAGAYTEITPDGAVRYEAPCVITRQAEQLHRLELDEPAWTYIVCGAARRKWGFATDRGWVYWQHYHGAAAIAACEPLTIGDSAPPPSRGW